MALAQRLVEMTPMLAPRLKQSSLAAALCTAAVVVSGRDLRQPEVAAVLRQLADEFEKGAFEHRHDA
jgi:hypothetical protein